MSDDIDELPVGGGHGGYSINWDAIDDSYNPFQTGSINGGKALACSPLPSPPPPLVTPPKEGEDDITTTYPEGDMDILPPVPDVFAYGDCVGGGSSFPSPPPPIATSVAMESIQPVDEQHSASSMSEDSGIDQSPSDPAVTVSQASMAASVDSTPCSGDALEATSFPIPDPMSSPLPSPPPPTCEDQLQPTVSTTEPALELPPPPPEYLEDYNCDLPLPPPQESSAAAFNYDNELMTASQELGNEYKPDDDSISGSSSEDDQFSMAKEDLSSDMGSCYDLVTDGTVPAAPTICTSSNATSSESEFMDPILPCEAPEMPKESLTEVKPVAEVQPLVTLTESSSINLAEGFLADIKVNKEDPKQPIKAAQPSLSPVNQSPGVSSSSLPVSSTSEIAAPTVISVPIVTQLQPPLTVLATDLPPTPESVTPKSLQPPTTHFATKTAPPNPLSTASLPPSQVKVAPSPPSLTPSVTKQPATAIANLAAPAIVSSPGSTETVAKMANDSEDVRVKELELEWKEKMKALQTSKMVLQEDKNRLTSTVDDMKKCIDEYERTLRQIIEEKGRAESASQVSIEDVLSERDQALEDLSTVEKAFGDLHRRFEKSKQVIDSFKQNEETLKRCLQDSQDKLKRQEQKYQTLKQHAEEKLKLANDEIDTLKRTRDADVTRLQAASKRAELQLQSLETQIDQKSKENIELTKICDELINKCGK